MTMVVSASAAANEYLAAWESRCLEIEAIELPANFCDLLDRAARLYGDRKALHFIDDDQQLTYNELRNHVIRLASSLYAAGIHKGTRVGVFLPNRLEFPLTWLALAIIGAVMVPTNTGYTGSELDYIYNDADISYLVVDETLLPVFEAMQERPDSLSNQNVFVVGEGDGHPYRPFDAMIEKGNAEFSSPEPPAANDLLNIQYTSGTTGFPKGCMQHQRYWIVLGATVGLMSPDIRSLLTDHPYFYMDPQWQLVWCLYSGVTDHVAAQMSSSRFWDRVRKHDIEWAWFPMPILKLPQTDSDSKHSIRTFYAGAISKEEVRLAEKRFGVPVRNAYGMTEIGAGTVVPYRILDDEVLDTVGLRAPFRELRIVNEAGNDVPEGMPGELVVRGDGLFLGYYNKPEANKNSFYGDWFRTGDMFVRTENGYYKIVGRFKDMIRRSSENISTMEVEHVIREMEEVAEAAAVPVPDDYRGEEVKVYVQLVNGKDKTDCPPELIIEHCLKRLAKFKVPRYVAYTETFPYTPSGKVAKHELIVGTIDLRTNSYDREDDLWR